MTERGQPLNVNEEQPIGTFLDAMREEVTGGVGSLFADDPRLASVKAVFVAEGPLQVSSSVDAVWYNEEDFRHGDGLYTRLVSEFASNNDLEASDIPSQWEVVKEELNEMAEEFEELHSEHIPEFAAGEPKAVGWERAAGNEPVERLAEEMADAVFTIHLLAHLAGVNLREEFREKANYNLEKSGERDENGKIIDDAEAGDD